MWSSLLALLLSPLMENGTSPTPPLLVWSKFLHLKVPAGLPLASWCWWCLGGKAVLALWTQPKPEPAFHDGPTSLSFSCLGRKESPCKEIHSRLHMEGSTPPLPLMWMQLSVASSFSDISITASIISPSHPIAGWTQCWNSLKRLIKASGASLKLFQSSTSF